MAVKDQVQVQIQAEGEVEVEDEVEEVHLGRLSQTRPDGSMGR